MGSRWSMCGNRSFARKRPLLSGNPKRDRLVSVFFVRLGVLVFGQSKTSRVLCKCFRISAGWVGSRGFQRIVVGDAVPRSGYPCSITACLLATLHRIFSIFITHRTFSLCLSA